MNIDLINNSGITNLYFELKEQMLTAKSFDIASAFITSEAIDLLNIFLTKNKNPHRIGRLITGFYQCFNSKDVLIKLQRLAKKSSGKLLINMSSNNRFHWKYYHFNHYNKEVSYIGSANLTDAGMNKPGELVLKLSLRHKDKLEKENFKKLYNKEFENSVAIAKIPLEDYKQSKAVKTKDNKLPDSIRDILNLQIKSKPIKKHTKSMHVTLLNGYLSVKTEKTVKEKKSNWDQSYYYACYNKSDYISSIHAGLLFIIQCYDRKYSFIIAEYIDDCQINTPDGNFFIAYKIKKTLKRETKNLRNKLEEIGLNYHSRSFTVKNLRNRQTETVKAILSYTE